MDKRIFGFLALALLLLVMPVVFADSVQSSIQSQIGANSVNYASYQDMQNLNPTDVLMKAIKDNPEVRREVIKSLIIIASIMLLTVLDIILKGFAMWKASKKNSRAWFWILLIVTTFGILPLLYLLISKSPEKESKKTEEKARKKSSK